MFGAPDTMDLDIETPTPAFQSLTLGKLAVANDELSFTRAVRDDALPIVVQFSKR